MNSVDPRGGWSSASNAQSDLLCPGRHLAQKGIPETPGQYAETGSRIDKALEKGDPAGLTLEETETFDACQSIEALKASEYFGADLPKAKVFRKTRYWVRFPVGDNHAVLKHSGETDVVYRYGGKAMICDYKALWGDVAESPANLQLRDYAVLVRGHLVLVDQVAVCIIQPRVSRNPEVCVYQKADLDRAAAELYERVVKSNDPKSPRVAGQPQCQYCRAKSLCVEYSKWTANLLPVVVEPARQAALFQVAMANWTPDQWALAADILAPAGKRLDEIKEAIKARLEADGASVRGWTLAPGSKRETITDPQAVYDRLAALGGTLEKYMKCLSVGKTLLKEVVHEVTGAKGAALNAAMDTLTKGLVEVKQTAPSLKKVEPK